MVGTTGAAADFTARLKELDGRLVRGALGVGVHDYLSGQSWHFQGDRWFHAASLVKLAVLLALFDAVQAGRFTLECRLHVRNRFSSVPDGTTYRVDASRDADADVYTALGRTMRLRELAQHMIVTSSNLATNLLLDLVGVEAARASLHRMGITGVDLRRGVEDHRAFEAGINNEVTPAGVVLLLKCLFEGRVLSPALSAEALDILHDQQFSGSIGPGLPEPVRAVARVAHKTGEITTVTHDAGLVFLPGRPPYVVAILVESDSDLAARTEMATAASTAIYEFVAAAGEGVRR
jgi:beta-lactamase class A